MNINVLITRPREQAQVLARAITSAGGRVVLCPMLEIVPLAKSSSLHHFHNKNTWQKADMIIFISPNAVQYGLPLLKEIYPTWPSSLQVAAIGDATAQQLKQAEIVADLMPEQQFSSEGLLELPAMQSVFGKTIIICKGEGGREELATSLRQRGATIIEFLAYKRQRPAITTKQFCNLWQQNNIDIVVATSGEAIENLWDIAGTIGRTYLQKKTLLVSSQRLLDKAKKLGFSKFLLADNASVEQILYTLASI